MKNFIRGIGLGIIAATLILSITYGVTKDRVSDQEIIRRAEELGMVKQSDSIFVTEKPQTEEKESDNAQNPSDAAVQQSSSIQNRAETDAQTEITGQNINVEVPTMVPVQETVVFTVESGQNGIQVSQKLAEMDLVDDAKAFNEYLRQKQIQTKLQVGAYELKKGMTYEEIAQKIIK